MNNLKIMHFGDMHLGLEFKNINFDSGFANQRRSEIWETFERIINRCNERFIDILLVAGDLYEEEYFTIFDMKRMASTFNLLKNTEVVIISGNHDPINETSLHTLVDWPSNVHIIKTNSIDKVEFCNLNAVVWGVSWNKKEEYKDLLKDVHIDNKEKINILLVHGDVYNQKSRYMPINLKSLKKLGFNYIALGHIHRHEFIEENIAYSGSPEPLDFSETGKHGVIEGILNHNSSDISFIPMSKREFIKSEINIDETMSYHKIIDFIVNSQSEEDRFKNIYTITLKGVIDRDIRIDCDMIKNIESKFTYVNIIDATQVDLDIDRLYTENKENIIGLFIKEMKRKNLNNRVNKRALYLGLETLLSEKVKS